MNPARPSFGDWRSYTPLGLQLKVLFWRGQHPDETLPREMQLELAAAWRERALDALEEGDVKH